MLKEGLGDWGTRASLRFLGSGQCSRIACVSCGPPKTKKALQFGRNGRLFYNKAMPKEKLRMRILGLLSPLQKRVLKWFTVNRKTYYYSAYELRKLFPYPGIFLSYSLDRLTKLGLLSIVQSRSGTRFYVEPKNATRLRGEDEKAVIEDKTEFVIVQIVHELIMNLYPSGLLTGLGGAIRPHTKEKLSLTGGMSFDIFYQLSENVGNKRFLAVDVYTRVPVTGYVVNSFIKKIEWSSSRRGRTAYEHNLKDKTYGMIVFKNSTPKAIQVALKNGIRFLRLSDIKTEYDDARKKAISLLNWRIPRLTTLSAHKAA